MWSLNSNLRGSLIALENSIKAYPLKKKKKQDSQLYIEYDSNYAKIKKKDKGINSQRQENKTPMVTLIVFEWWDFW